MSSRTYADYGIEVPAHGAGECRTTCPKCSAGRTKSGEKCLAVNLDKRTWFCHHCGETGGLPAETHAVDPHRPREHAASVAQVKPRPLSQAALAWLGTRGISQATAEAAGVTSADTYFRDLGTTEAVAFVYTSNGVAVGAKYRSVAGKAFSQNHGGCKSAYLHDLAAGCGQVVITEGEIDALSVMECDVQGAVSCPEGAPPVNARADGKLEFLDVSADVFKGAGRIILAMDNDEPGIRWRDAIAERLGPDRCFTVAWPAGCKDANDVLVKHGRDALLAALRDARPYPCPGLHEPDEYAAALLARHASPARTGYPTGWKNLDAYLRIEPGTMHIVTGIPSSGKSEWLDGLALNTASLHGWRWAIFSPENYPVDRHLAKLVEKRVGRPFRDIPASEVMTALAWVQEHFVFFSEDDRGISVERLAGLLKAAVARYGIRGAIIDPWNEIEHSRPQYVNESEYIGSALTLLRNLARREGFALFIAAHPTKMERQVSGDYGVPTPYDISGSANWRNKADVCIAVWRPLAKPEPWADIHIQKVRFRDVGQLGKCRLYWRKATGCFGDAAE
jgi:twinkle protein